MYISLGNIKLSEEFSFIIQLPFSFIAIIGKPEILNWAEVKRAEKGARTSTV